MRIGQTYRVENDEGFSAKILQGLLWLRKISLQFPHITKSVLFHLLLVVFMSGMLPTCSRDIQAPKTISIDIIPFNAPTKPNATPTPPKAQPKPAEKPKPNKIQKTVEMKKKETVAKVEAPKEEQVKNLPKPTVKPLPKPKIEKPKPEVVKPKPEPENDSKMQDKSKQDSRDQEGKKSLLKDTEKKENLDSIFEDITNDKQALPENKSTVEQAKPAEPAFVPDAAFVSEISGKIQSQVSVCWNIPIGVQEINGMSVKLYIEFAANGAATKVEVIDMGRYNSEPTFRVLADSAVWAVKECSPIQGLPVDKHEFWKEVEFNFDPSAAL